MFTSTETDPCLQNAIPSTLFVLYSPPLAPNGIRAVVRVRNPRRVLGTHHNFPLLNAFAATQNVGVYIEWTDL